MSRKYVHNTREDVVRGSRWVRFLPRGSAGLTVLATPEPTYYNVLVQHDYPDGGQGIRTRPLIDTLLRHYRMVGMASVTPVASAVMPEAMPEIPPLPNAPRAAPRGETQVTPPEAVIPSAIVAEVLPPLPNGLRKLAERATAEDVSNEATVQAQSADTSPAPARSTAKCIVCAHPNRAGIDAALRSGEGLRRIALRLGSEKTALGRHRKVCLGIIWNGNSHPRAATNTWFNDGVIRSHLDDVGMFVDVARHRSYTNAAKLRGVSKSTLSRAVQRLESVLCAKLVVATRTSVTLTPAGTALFSHARPLIEALTKQSMPEAAEQDDAVDAPLPVEPIAPAPDAEAAQAPPPSSDVVVRMVDGWRVSYTGDDEPRMADVDLGERLGYARPAKIRDLIKRHVEAGNINDIRIVPTVGRIQLRPGVYREETVETYYLTEAGALFIAAKAETKPATALLNEMIRVYQMARRGDLPASASLAAIREIGAMLVQSQEASAKQLTQFMAAAETRQERFESKIAALIEKHVPTAPAAPAEHHATTPMASSGTHAPRSGEWLSPSRLAVRLTVDCQRQLTKQAVGLALTALGYRDRPELYTIDIVDRANGADGEAAAYRWSPETYPGLLAYFRANSPKKPPPPTRQQPLPGIGTPTH